MPNLKVTVQVEIDGVPLSGFPLVRRLEMDEAQQFNYEKAADGDTITFTALPAGELTAIQALIIRNDIPVTVRLDNQTDAGIELNSGGLLLLVDATIDAGAGALNAKLNNPDATAAAIVKGVAAGT